MRLVTESGLWVTGPSVAPVPLAAVQTGSGDPTEPRDTAISPITAPRSA